MPKKKVANKQTLSGGVNNKLIVGVLVVLLLGGGAYFLNMKQGGTMGTGGLMGGAGSGAGTVGDTIMSALMGGQSMTCTYSGEEGESIIYIKNKKVRADFSSLAMGDPQQGSGSMINDGEYMYMWSDEDKQGMKMKVEVPEPGDDTYTTEGSDDDFADVESWAQGLDDEEDVECKSGPVMDSLFTPPSDVTFQDFSAWSESMQQMQQDMPESGELSDEQMRQLEELMQQAQ